MKRESKLKIKCLFYSTKLASKEAQAMFIDIFRTHDNIFKSQSATRYYDI